MSVIALNSRHVLLVNRVFAYLESDWEIAWNALKVLSTDFDYFLWVALKEIASPENTDDIINSSKNNRFIFFNFVISASEMALVAACGVENGQKCSIFGMREDYMGCLYHFRKTLLLYSML